MESFTEQLRRIDDADLDPYQFRLIMHYWRVGTCWETLRTTAEKCGMSLAKVHGTQKWLLDNGWIEYQPVKMKSGKAKMAIVLCSLHEQTQQLDSSHSEHCSPDEQECSPHEQEPVELVHDVNAILNEPKELNEPSEMEEEAPFAFRPLPAGASREDSPADARLKAIAAVCFYDLEVDKHRVACESASAQLGRFTAERILERYAKPNGIPPKGWNWYLHDWRGLKGQTPVPDQIVMTITTPVPEEQSTGRHPPAKQKDDGIPKDVIWT